VERLLLSLKSSRGISELCKEVIIVNNASTDDSSSFLETQAREWSLLKVLSEERPGKNFALNKGLREASGEIICLMDDDIVLDPDWLTSLARDFEETEYDALQPRVLPGRDPSGDNADLERLYRYNIPVIDYGDSVRGMRGLTGVIMSFRKEVIDKVGGFDERLPASGYHGDTDISERIRAAGYRIGYTPHVLAYHELNPERYGAKYARISQYRKGLSRSIYGNSSLLTDVLPNLWANCMRYGYYRLRHMDAKMYRTEKRIMKYWGYLVGRIHRRLGRDPWV
jgi:GT2 family glycosyltransferase